MVMLVESESIPNRKRGLLCQNRRAGIALFLGRIKIAVIAMQFKDRLLRLKLCLLQADHIGVFLRAVSRRKPLPRHARRPLTFQDTSFIDTSK